MIKLEGTYGKSILETAAKGSGRKIREKWELL